VVDNSFASAVPLRRNVRCNIMCFSFEVTHTAKQIQYPDYVKISYIHLGHLVETFVQDLTLIASIVVSSFDYLY
jgi:hypothetical protein